MSMADLAIQLVTTLIVGLILGSLIYLSASFRLRFGIWLGIFHKPEGQSYKEKLAKLTTDLSRASSEVDVLFAELGLVTKEREETIEKLERRVADLEGREELLKKRVQDLQNVPIPVAEHFAMLLKPGEKKSALRDYLLFAAGAFVSFVISLLIR